MCYCSKALKNVGLLVGTALLLCSAAGAAEAKRNTPNKPATKGSGIHLIKPVTSDLDTDLNAKYRRSIKSRYSAQDKKMKEAVALVEKGKYSQGVRLAESVRDELKLESEYVKGEVVAARLAEAEALVARLRLKWGQERIRMAANALQDKRINDAISFATEAANISSALVDDADAIRKRAFEIQRNDKFQTATRVNVANPYLEKQRKEVDNLFREALVFYQNKRYSEAVMRIEQIFLRNPFDVKAIALANKIYEQYYTYGYHRHRADYELLAAYSNWQWAEPVFEMKVSQEKITTEEKDNSTLNTYNKLNRIIFPRFEFDRADVSSVIKFLHERNKEFDPEKEGVDINNSSTPEDMERLGKVTLSLSNIPLGEVLRYVSLMTGLKYRVERDGVRLGTAIDTMYEQTYDIRSHVLSMVAADSEVSGGAAGSDAEGGTGKAGVFKLGKEEVKLEKEQEIDQELKVVEAEETKVTSEMFKKYLMLHGIKFGPGSSVVYLEPTRELVVKNTRQNLNAIGTLIKEQNMIQARMIMVEIKSIEISDTDMEELGFDWSLGDTNLNSNMDNNGQLVNPSKGGWMLGSGMNTRENTETGERGSMNPIRTGFADGSQSSTLINNLNIFPMLFGSQTPFGSDVPINISLTINALSQNTKTELLSAPKVIATSGTLATAKLTKTYYFPDDWSDLEVETDTGDDNTTFTIKQPSPEFGDEEELGIIMSVLPTVNENDIITLDINMQVKGRNGDDEFTFQLNGTVNGRNISRSFRVWKPVITERLIKTQVDLYDGQTVVIGGSTDNRTLVRNDKIPFLGDLPFIGRLFQSQSEKAERKNMLLFVTARIVGADGAMMNNSRYGVPDFNR